MSTDWYGRVFTNGTPAAPFIVLGVDQAQGSEDPARIRGRGHWVFWDEVDVDFRFDPFQKPLTRRRRRRLRGGKTASPRPTFRPWGGPSTVARGDTIMRGA